MWVNNDRCRVLQHEQCTGSRFIVPSSTHHGAAAVEGNVLAAAIQSPVRPTMVLLQLKAMYWQPVSIPAAATAFLSGVTPKGRRLGVWLA